MDSVCACVRVCVCACASFVCVCGCECARCVCVLLHVSTNQVGTKCKRENQANDFGFRVVYIRVWGLKVGGEISGRRYVYIYVYIYMYIYIGMRIHRVTTIGIYTSMWMK